MVGRADLQPTSKSDMDAMHDLVIKHGHYFHIKLQAALAIVKKK